MECMTIRRGYFRGFTAAEKTGTLGSLAAWASPWDSNPSRKNEIECCVDRLNPPPKADIAVAPSRRLQTGLPHRGQSLGEPTHRQVQGTLDHQLLQQH